jgi:hypothetical protein
VFFLLSVLQDALLKMKKLKGVRQRRTQYQDYRPDLLSADVGPLHLFTFSFSAARFVARPSRRTFPGKSIHTEISPLRFASVEMTKGSVALPENVVCLTRTVFHHLA